MLNDRLSPARSTTIQCDLHLDQVEVSAAGDFKTSSLAPHVNTPTINDLIVRSYLHRAGDRRSTLIFCVDLRHVANVTQAFREAGIDARSVSSISAGKSRKETLDAFANGEFPVLVNCEVLTEGTDIPVVSCRKADLRLMLMARLTALF
jgi:ATP-dependent helicase IRC3